tara:strand:+ start:285 stop:743 length:459 start_codon:yes stop_codon:yes gene_type:complete
MATLTITVKENILINGADRGSENVNEITGINETYSRVVDIVNNADIEVLKFGSADGAGTIDRTKLKYLRFTNLSTTAANTITLSIEDTDAEQYIVKVAAGQSYVLYNTDFDANDASTSVAIGNSYSFGGSIDLIMARAAAGTPQLEVFAAMA